MAHLVRSLHDGGAAGWHHAQLIPGTVTAPQARHDHCAGRRVKRRGFVEVEALPLHVKPLRRQEGAGGRLSLGSADPQSETYRLLRCEHVADTLHTK